jgi:hypothetical protein
MTVSLDAIPSRMAAVVPSDTVSQPGAALYVGGTGDVSLTNGAGDTAVFKAVPAGTILPVQFGRVNATNTTATLLIRLY